MPTGSRKLTRNKTYLIKANFDARVESLGLETIADKARFVGVVRPTFSRVYRGVRGAGGPVIDAVLKAPWPEPVVFGDLFWTEAA